MKYKYNIDELDCIYLTYDEPRCEETWLTIQNEIPWAKRVHGVKGSDSAHKAAAEISDTERFILIDGDNMPYFKFFEQTLILDDDQSQLRWRSRNSVNNLCYGNGGMSCWTKSHIMNMRTHENSEGKDETAVEFCFHNHYYAMHDVVSDTNIHYTPNVAFRSGFREGVKMCLRHGQRIDDYDFKSKIWPDNLRSLSIWHSIGMDVENGFWAILGARAGTYYVMNKLDWDYRLVRDHDAVDAIYNEHSSANNDTMNYYGDYLKHTLKLSVEDFTSEQSKFIKDTVLVPRRNLGISVREDLGSYFNDLS